MLVSPSRPENFKKRPVDLSGLHMICEHVKGSVNRSGWTNDMKSPRELKGKKSLKGCGAGGKSRDS